MLCWSGDGNDGIHYSVHDTVIHTIEEVMEKPRCVECVQAINDIVSTVVTDDQLKEILGAKVARKGLKLTNVLKKLTEKWEADNQPVIEKRPEPEW